jgi:hypothetical protein
MAEQNLMRPPPPTAGGTPDVRTRKIERVRHVEHTIDGITRVVPETYTVRIPLPPRDWDHVIFVGIVTAASVMVTAAVSWSTVSIGALLCLVAPALAAYLAAAVFDLTWIVCLGVEWLSRFDPRRAAGARKAGHAALVVAMAAIAAHGWAIGKPWVGVAGAGVSALAKVAVVVVMRYCAPRFDPLTEAWVRQEDAAASAGVALVAVKRRASRARRILNAEAAAFGPSTDMPGLPAAPVQTPAPAMPEAPPVVRAEPSAQTPADAPPDTQTSVHADTSGQQTRRSQTTVWIQADAASDTDQTVADTARRVWNEVTQTPDEVVAAVRAVWPNATRDYILRAARGRKRSA